VAAQARAGRSRTIAGDEVFKLYDTFGFPVDLVERMAEEAGLAVDLEGFEAAMAEQRRRSRGASAFAGAEREDGEWLSIVQSTPPTVFRGYEDLSGEGELVAIVERGGLWRAILDATPFYAESGGQVGDTGILECDGVRLRVVDTQKDQGRHVHVCLVEEGDPRGLRRGGVVKAAVDAERRLAVARNHSATHLLHAALRAVVGAHVHQKGSLVSPERLRFDVTHFQAVRPEELDRASALVRERILANIPVEVEEMSRDEAIARGALAFFGEKYGERVRVVRMGEFSMELCGGTHVARTGDLGPFVVVHEGSVSSGVRRLEALTAAGAEAHHRGHADLLARLSQMLKIQPEALPERLEKLLAEAAELRARLRERAAARSDGSVRRERVGDVLLVLGLYEGVAAKDLRGLHDGFKGESDRLITVLVAREEGKVSVLITVAKALEDAGWSAQEVFRAGAELLGARGGGRAGMVQAGGSRPEAAESALAAFEARVRRGP
jgi:alanyl-tRNA synthetase